MKTVKVSISNTGMLAQVVKAPGGTITVKPNDRLKDVDILPLTAERVKHYAERGVTFSGKGVPAAEPEATRAKPAAKGGAETAALEQAVKDADAALADAQKGNDLDKIAAAQAALDEAEKSLKTAKGDR